ncbi:MAG: HAMP domain-containing histidine kinase [Nitrosopumilus sp.]|nr:HAMP domain-containing histidine kinase [Nitrosopumilus sp.]
MSPKQQITLIVSLELFLIASSFLFTAYLESEWIELGQSINSAGLNRFLTSEIRLSVQDSIIKGSFEKPLLLEKLKDNLFLIKDGGMIKNTSVKSLPVELHEDWKRVYNQYVLFEKNISSIPDMNPENRSNLLLLLDESSSSLIQSSDDLVFKITSHLEKLHSMLIKLQIILLFTNTLVHLLMIYLIFLILNKDANEKIKLEQFATIGKLGATLAHDIRNSLTVIKGSVAILKMEENHNGDLKEKQYEKIRRSVDQITYLTNDILSYTRIMELKKEEFIFSEIIQASLDEIMIPNQVIIKLPLNDYKINADKIKLQTVISNLIKNSIDAIGENGMVVMNLKKTHDFFVFSITDSAKDSVIDISQIFTPLYTTKLHGTGLGLASCKKIIEQHGGKITVSTDPTTFTIFIPRK